MNNLYLKHFVEIGVPGAAEVISEIFDDAINLLPSSAVVFGGAVRDLAAGLPLLGDLDIIVPKQYYKQVVHDFMTAPKWCPTDNSPSMTAAIKAIPSNKTAETEKAYHNDFHSEFSDEIFGNTEKSNYDTYAKNKSKSLIPSRFRSLRSTNDYPEKELSTFVTFNDKKIQIISTKLPGDTIEDSLFVARHVDIICCGMIMTTEGVIYEVIPGAYQDCVDKVLHLNETTGSYIDYDRTISRIAKLEKRGWTSKIKEKGLKTFIQKQKTVLKKAQQIQDQKTIKRAGLLTKNTFSIEEGIVSKLDKGNIGIRAKVEAQNIGVAASKIQCIFENGAVIIKCSGMDVETIARYKNHLLYNLKKSISKREAQKTLYKTKITRTKTTRTKGKKVLPEPIEEAFPTQSDVNSLHDTYEESSWPMTKPLPPSVKKVVKGVAEVRVRLLGSHLPINNFRLDYDFNLLGSGNNNSFYSELSFPDVSSKKGLIKALTTRAIQIVNEAPVSPSRIRLVLDPDAAAIVGVNNLHIYNQHIGTVREHPNSAMDAAIKAAQGGLIRGDTIESVRYSGKQIPPNKPYNKMSMHNREKLAAMSKLYAGHFSPIPPTKPKKKHKVNNEE